MMYVRPRKSSRSSSQHDNVKSDKSYRERLKRAEAQYDPTPVSDILETTAEIRRAKEMLKEMEALKESRKEAPSGQNDSSSSVVVSPEHLQATFENVICYIREMGDTSLAASTVLEMLETMYEWMVFDENTQITMPSEPGSTTVQKMWPQGSRIDTRRKKDRSTTQSSARSLKRVDSEYASTVASSVISSSLGDDGMRIRKGSIVYSDRGHVTRSDSGFQHEYPRPAQLRQESHQYEYTPPSPMYQHPQVTQPFVPAPVAIRGGPRYSLVGATVEAPQRVQETPQMEPSRPVRRKVKAPKVGASSRPVANDDEGTDVQFAD